MKGGVGRKLDDLSHKIIFREKSAQIGGEIVLKIANPNLACPRGTPASWVEGRQRVDELHNAKYGVQHVEEMMVGRWCVFFVAVGRWGESKQEALSTGSCCRGGSGGGDIRGWGEHGVLLAAQGHTQRHHPRLLWGDVNHGGMSIWLGKVWGKTVGEALSGLLCFTCFFLFFLFCFFLLQHNRHGDSIVHLRTALHDVIEVLQDGHLELEGVVCRDGRGGVWAGVGVVGGLGLWLLVVLLVVMATFISIAEKLRPIHVFFLGRGVVPHSVVFKRS